MAFRTVNPASGETLAEYRPDTVAEAIERADAAAAAFRAWRRTTFDARGAVLVRAAELLRRDREAHAALMAREMGKPVREGVREVEKCAGMLEHYAEFGERYLRDIPVETEAARSGVVHAPIGVVLGIMPWNFPFWQFFRYAAPTLMAGNATLLKHAPNVQGCAEAMIEVFREAGAGDAALNVRLEPEDVPALMDHPGVRAVTLTGSVRAGRAVAAEAGRRILKTVLELGGSDPYLILEDADLGHAVEQCAVSRLINTGQSCIAAKRLVVVEPLYDAFVEQLSARLREVEPGDPMDPDTVIGPMARVDLRDALHGQVSRAIDEGARLYFGGTIPDRPGAWYPVTLLTEVRPDSVAGQEELFGPVACVLRARDEAHAIAIANDTPFGLGAAVFTEDRERGERIARDDLDAGACFVNAFVRSRARLPFGGVKESGYGRELGSFGIAEFTNAKAIWVD